MAQPVGRFHFQLPGGTAKRTFDLCVACATKLAELVESFLRSAE